MVDRAVGLPAASTIPGEQYGDLRWHEARSVDRAVGYKKFASVNHDGVLVLPARCTSMAKQTARLCSVSTAAWLFASTALAKVGVSLS